MFFYFINLILQFFSRKIFLDYLGAEVLGLNTTAQNLLGVLNLAELGIGTAVAYSLYKPLFEGNRQAINDIVSIQGWLYRRIAFIIIAGAVVLMCFFPLLFAKAQVPLWYAYGSFIALLIAALLGYFVNYRQVVLSADQKEYKITQSVQGGKITKVILQLLAICYFQDGYVWWMILEVLMAVATSYVLDRSIRREYPWLRSQVADGKRLKDAYPEIVKKTKQLFFHKIGVFVLTQTSPLVIYAYASLTLVAVYGNYMLITLGVTALMNAILNGLNAGIGNLVAGNDKRHIKNVFWEITLLRMWLASIVCFGLYILGDSFVTLWVGAEYILPPVAFVILIINTFISLTRTNDSFIAAYGLFQDVWAPVAEASLNLGFSILLGHFFDENTYETQRAEFLKDSGNVNLYKFVISEDRKELEIRKMQSQFWRKYVANTLMTMENTQNSVVSPGLKVRNTNTNDEFICVTTVSSFESGGGQATLELFPCVKTNQVL